ncbi:hypothetical protein CLAFUW4_10493 [Fulvia fulva]|nr:hypothetical protein CLAFUR4_10496 [Fulvia fulva]WPV19666.1 hypothetical protein CLAFUW4_10493 [Fulvia fulva]WPV33786.1 hypothetical protein CLAFUW7_10493 [Fulvia fulva]
MAKTSRNPYGLVEVREAEFDRAFTGAFFAKASTSQQDTADYRLYMGAWRDAFWEFRATLVLLDNRTLEVDELKRILQARLCLQPYWSSTIIANVTKPFNAEQLRFKDDLVQILDHVVDIAEQEYNKHTAVNDHDAGDGATGYAYDDVDKIILYSGHDPMHYEGVALETVEGVLENHVDGIPAWEVLVSALKEHSGEFLEAEA